MSQPLLTQAQIAERIPHAGSMVLLSSVVSADEQQLVATAELRNDSPLAFEGQLGSETLLEYAGQCMAIHGAITAEGASDDNAVDAGAVARLAFISQVKSFQWAGDALPVATATITVNQQGGTAGGAIYQFVAEADGVELGNGVISIMFSN